MNKLNESREYNVNLWILILLKLSNQADMCYQWTPLEFCPMQYRSLTTLRLIDKNHPPDHVTLSKTMCTEESNLTKILCHVSYVLICTSYQCMISRIYLIVCICSRNGLLRPLLTALYSNGTLNWSFLFMGL